MNSTKYDVINNLQKDIKRKVYVDNDVIGFIDIGKKRNSQEDSLLILSHPIYKAQLLLIADGMGGLEHGEIASNIAAREIMNWFCKFNFRSHDINYLSNDYKEKIHYIDELLRCEVSTGGSTIVSAICDDSKTLITNIGDSRCYIYNNHSLIQITEDHNLAWSNFQNGVLSKDDLRYLVDNNLLTSRVGWKKKMLKIDSFIIDNSSYNKLLLCSDGLTDVLPDDTIKYCLINLSINNAEELIDYINNYNEKDNYYNGTLFKKEINGGDDNMSIIVKNNKRVRK